jgi:transcription elongation factor Elf1
MVAKVKITCGACGRNFTFTGQTGYSPNEATVSETLDELRIPVKYPSGEEEGEEENKEEGEEVFQSPPVYLH